MSEVVAVGLITGGATFLTALIGLAGLIVVQHFESVRASASARRERLLEARGPLSEFVAATDGYTNGWSVLALMHAAPGFSSNDLVEFVNTDSGKQIARDRQSMIRALADIKTLIDDAELATLVVAFEEKIADMTASIDRIGKEQAGVDRAGAAGRTTGKGENAKRLANAIHARAAAVIQMA